MQYHINGANKKIDKINDFQNIVNEIKQMDQGTINGLSTKIAEDFYSNFYSRLDGEDKIKLLGVCLALYDKSSGKAKNVLATELLKYRIGKYAYGIEKKKRLDMLQKAKKMLNRKIKEDVTVKGLTRKSYTPLSSLNRQLRKYDKDLSNR